MSNGQTLTNTTVKLTVFLSRLLYKGTFIPISNEYRYTILQVLRQFVFNTWINMVCFLNAVKIEADHFICLHVEDSSACGSHSCLVSGAVVCLLR